MKIIYPIIGLKYPNVYMQRKLIPMKICFVFVIHIIKLTKMGVLQGEILSPILRPKIYVNIKLLSNGTLFL